MLRRIFSKSLEKVLLVSRVQKSLPNHQWISISIDEPSFYTLKMTTESLRRFSLFPDTPHRSRPPSPIAVSQFGKLCYMFKETFADLQAILLLGMEWGDYAQLLTQHPQHTAGR